MACFNDGSLLFVSVQGMHMISFWCSQYMLGFFSKLGSTAFTAFWFWNTHYKFRPNPISEKRLRVWYKCIIKSEKANTLKKIFELLFFNLMISELTWEWLSHACQIPWTGNISDKDYSKVSRSSALPLTLLLAPEELWHFILCGH